jgi:hypothetical protein
VKGNLCPPTLPARASVRAWRGENLNLLIKTSATVYCKADTTQKSHCNLQITYDRGSRPGQRSWVDAGLAHTLAAVSPVAVY